MKSYTFVAEGPPRAKGRPRVTRGGKAYTPATTRDAEWTLASQYDGPTFEGPIAVHVQYMKDNQRITITEADHSSKMRADVDNLVKLTLDALQRSTAFDNDRMVVDLRAVKVE